MFHFSENAIKILIVINWRIFSLSLTNHPTTQLRYRKPSSNQDKRMEKDELKILKKNRQQNSIYSPKKPGKLCVLSRL